MRSTHCPESVVYTPANINPQDTGRPFKNTRSLLLTSSMMQPTTWFLKSIVALKAFNSTIPQLIKIRKHVYYPSGELTKGDTASPMGDSENVSNAIHGAF